MSIIPGDLYFEVLVPELLDLDLLFGDTEDMENQREELNEGQPMMNENLRIAEHLVQLLLTNEVKLAHPQMEGESDLAYSIR